MPAFSLPRSPPRLTARLQPTQNAPLPLFLLKEKARSFGFGLEPPTFSAQERSTSELLRTL